jgi:uncharacterized protein YneF (UPF0154 family)
MDNLLDLSPEQQKEKIKNIITEVIKKKNDKIELLQKEIESLRNQEETDKYYMKLSKKPEISINYIGGAFVSLLSDIIVGFAEASKQIQKDFKSRPQIGGTTEEEVQKIQKESANLNSLIGELERLLKKYEEVSSKSLGPGTVQSQFKDGLNNAKNMGIAILKTGVKWSEEFINEMLNLSMDLSGEKNILDTPIDELSPELNKKVLLLAAILKELSENPATKEAVREIAEAIGTSLIEIMEEIKPELDKVSDEAVEMVDQVAVKSARGAMATGVSVAQAVLAEIPWIGGLIDFFLALGKGFNAFMEVGRTFSDKGGELAISNAKVIKGTEDSVNEGIERIKASVEKAKKTLQEAQKEPSLPSTPDINNEGNIQRAGGKEYIPDKKIRNKIQKAGKRLGKTLKIFNKTLPKMNYSLKQNNKRKAKKSQKNKKKYTRKYLV